MIDITLKCKKFLMGKNMNKYFIGLMLLCLCACGSKNKMLKQYQSEVWNVVENARMNNEPSCILGGKLKNIFAKYKVVYSFDYVEKIK